MIFRIFLSVFLISMSALTANAETINFNCKGSTSYNSGGKESIEFDLKVTTSPPRISGPVGPLGLCHIGIPDDSLRKVQYSCEMSESELSCSCNGGNFIQGSTHRLSRLTGKLTFISTLKNDVWFGNYSCKKVASNVF